MIPDAVLPRLTPTLIEAIKSVEASGLAVVPRTATDQMQEAGFQAVAHHNQALEKVMERTGRLPMVGGPYAAMWTAMLDAAPKVMP